MSETQDGFERWVESNLLLGEESQVPSYPGLWIP